MPRVTVSVIIVIPSRGFNRRQVWIALCASGAVPDQLDGNKRDRAY